VESEAGTVQDDIITSNNPETEINLPHNLALPLIANHMPKGIKHRGIQNQIAASNIESMVGTAAL
jgi:hypothetical protein